MKPPLQQLFALSHLIVSGQCLAQDTVDPSRDGADATVEEPSGILPVPDYTGELWSRSYLAGDWNGARADLADKGFQFRLDYTQTAQSVVDGGRESKSRYGGSLGLVVDLDLQRMGVMPGALVNIRAESRYGESLNSFTGQVFPANLDGFFPLASEPDDDIPLAITSLYYTQFVSEEVGFLIGKFDNLEGDFNEFASGRGTSQFMNANFVFTPVTLTEPYSTLGGGLIWMPNEHVFAWSILYNTMDSSTTSGFSDVGDGWSWLTELYLQYSIDGLPGGVMVGTMYDFDNDFAELGTQRLVLGPNGIALTSDRVDDTWAVYSNLWQYLWTPEPSDGVVDIQNHEVDLPGVGFFLRGGTADDRVNPIEWTMSGGLSGRGVIPSREFDTFGVGYFYTSVRTGRLTRALGVNDSSQGFEAYYRLAITPSTHLTADFQVLDSPLPDTDTALVAGLRLNLRF